jgi:hypothetical protein
MKIKINLEIDLGDIDKDEPIEISVNQPNEDEKEIIKPKQNTPVKNEEKKLENLIPDIHSHVAKSGKVYNIRKRRLEKMLILISKENKKVVKFKTIADKFAGSFGTLSFTVKGLEKYELINRIDHRTLEISTRGKAYLLYLESKKEEHKNG